MLRRAQLGRTASASATATTASQPLLRSLSLAARHHGSASNGLVHCREKKKLTRDPRFKTVTAKDIDFFRSVVGADARALVAAPSPDLDPFNFDWFKEYKGDGPVCLLPKSTAEVSELVRYCNAERIAVVPQGGNTGFVGGSVPVFDEVILSLKRMNKVLELDAISGTIKCEAGCILENLDNQVKDHGFLMPVDLGAKGSCQVGGNVSTSAGGLRFMRYGSMHGNTLGLTVVLPSGEVLDLMNVLRKDNTGYDLKHLFIGAEGTLGIVTEVAMQLASKPNAVNTTFFGCKDWDSLCQLFVAARRDLGEILSAVEMIDGVALDLVLDITKGSSPLPERCPYYMLVETNGSNQEHDQAKLFAFLEKVSGDGTVAAGTVAETAAQSKHIWSMRELCATAPDKIGHVRWYDVSMPSVKMSEMINGARAALAAEGLSDKAKIMGFGHFGDGNLHINTVTIPEYDQRVVDTVDGYIYGLSKQRRYSVSAEHGIGLQKKSYLPYSKKPETIRHMVDVKRLFDPNGIMNPYKVFQ